MGSIKRQVIEISMEQIADVDYQFGRHAQIDMDHVPQRFSLLVDETKKACMERVRPVGVILSVKVDGIHGTVVELSDGEEHWKIDSALMAKLFCDSFEAVWFAATLQGFDELLEEMSSHMMKQFFVDAWGSAFISRWGVYMTDYVKNIIRENGLYSTSVWNPGQHGLAIETQKEAFSILRPEEIDLKLTSTMLMIPAKSVSGTFGINEQEDFREWIACDYCSLRENCPSAYNRKASGGMCNDIKFHGKIHRGCMKC